MCKKKPDMRRMPAGGGHTAFLSLYHFILFYKKNLICAACRVVLYEVPVLAIVQEKTKTKKPDMRRM